MVCVRWTQRRPASSSRNERRARRGLSLVMRRLGPSFVTRARGVVLPRCDGARVSGVSGSLPHRREKGPAVCVKEPCLELGGRVEKKKSCEAAEAGLGGASAGNGAFEAPNPKLANTCRAEGS